MLLRYKTPVSFFQEYVNRLLRRKRNPATLHGSRKNIGTHESIAGEKLVIRKDGNLVIWRVFSMSSLPGCLLKSAPHVAEKHELLFRTESAVKNPNTLGSFHSLRILDLWVKLSAQRCFENARHDKTQAKPSCRQERHSYHCRWTRETNICWRLWKPHNTLVRLEQTRREAEG